MLLSDYLQRHVERGKVAGRPPDGPVNRQIYELMRQVILRGELAAHSKLPSSRELAADIGLSRNTVIAAYQQLLAEGYIEARAGSGTFVSDTLSGLGKDARRTK